MTEPAVTTPVLSLLGCDVDLEARLARWSDGSRTLTPTEASLLKYLILADGRAVDRAELLEKVWGYRPGVVSRTVKTTVARLRAKTERMPREPEHVLTVVGRGYRFVPADPDALTLARTERPVHEIVDAAVDGPTRVSLPPASEELVGRDTLVATTRTHCGTPGLVTLVGPGGIGKTSVALVVCHQEAEGAAWDEVASIAVHACTTETDIVAALASGLGVSAEGVGLDDAIPFLAGALRGRGRLLLLLDGGEAASSELARVLPLWIRSCPQTTFLVTTREVLRVAGEVVVPIEPLSQAEAVSLFLSRLAPHPAPGYTHEAVDQLVDQLDRIPLAIEMAAAWGDLINAESLCRRLGSQLDVLRSPRRDRPTRHGSLRTTIASSWALLAEPNREGLRQLAVFADAFSIDDAEQILAGGPSPFELLRSLRDRSLLTRTRLSSGEPGLRLFRAVRDFAREQGLDGEAVIRHGRWASRWGEAQRLERLRSAGGRELSAMTAARADIVLAGERAQDRGDARVHAACAFALATLGELAGPALADPEMLLAVGDREEQPRTALRALAAAAALLMAQGESQRVDPLIARLTPLLDAVPPHDAARALLDTAQALESRSLERAHEAALQACSFARESEDAGLLAVATARIARLEHARGDAVSAQRGFEASLEGLAGSGNLREEANTLSALAGLHAERGRPLRAMALHEQALLVHQQVGDRLAQAREFDAVACLRTLAEDHGGAAEAWESALTLVRASGDRRLEATVAAHQAAADRASGRGEASRIRLLKALSLSREVGDVRIEVLLLGELGELDLSLGHFPAARASLLRAIQGAVRLGAPDLEGVSRGALGELLSCSGELDQGRAEFARGAALLDGAHKRLALVTLLERHAEVEAAAGDADAAAALLGQAAESAELSVLDGSA